MLKSNFNTFIKIKCVIANLLGKKLFEKSMSESVVWID